MNQFYVPHLANTSLTENTSLPQAEARHCLQVLRHQVGDVIIGLDGQGTTYQLQIVEAKPKKSHCIVRIIAQNNQPAQLPLHIAIAPTKNNTRLEWFLEKATEIGITEITPIYCHHSERRNLRIDRLQKVLVAAMKQAQRAWLPELHEPISYTKFLKQEPLQLLHKYIAYVPQKQYYLHQALQLNPSQSSLIAIGPEGGFSPTEVQQAQAVGFKAVSLGTQRLRTETAGVVACHTVQLMRQMQADSIS